MTEFPPAFPPQNAGAAAATPFQLADAGVLAIGVESASASPVFGSSETASYGRDILVVDDNPSNLVAMEVALAPLGRRLVLAHSGTEALSCLLRGDFALVVLDVQMPGMDGFETAQLMRSRDRCRSTPIIFVTGISWPEDTDLRGYELGAFDFMMKPIRPAVLRAKASVFIQLQERTIDLQRKSEELRQAQARAHEHERQREAGRAKDEFIAMLGHELRNPLAPIVMALDLMRSHSPNNSERERAIIERQVAHMIRLVDDLLDISRITQGKIELRRERHELADIVARAVELASPLLEKKSHKLSVEIAARGFTVDGDMTRLSQAVANLVTNAAKYTERSGTIVVDARRLESTILLRVRDSGIGISAEMLPRVFDLFTQESQATDRPQGGLGLGLAIVKSIVVMHGGAVTARSEGIGRGSEFLIELPAAIEQVEAVLIGELKPQREFVGAEPAVARRILVVDDNEDAGELLADALGRLGHDVRVAVDGPSALLMVGTFVPDVALLDIGLPVMDGYELVRRLRALLPSGGTRFIALTGYGQGADRRRSEEAGFDLHLVKPVSLETLKNGIKQLAISAEAD